MKLAKRQLIKPILPVNDFFQVFNWWCTLVDSRHTVKLELKVAQLRDKLRLTSAHGFRGALGSESSSRLVFYSGIGQEYIRQIRIERVGKWEGFPTGQFHSGPGPSLFWVTGYRQARVGVPRAPGICRDILVRINQNLQLIFVLLLHTHF